ncbi:hypothetical protein ACNKHO_21380 [Shigella flexneri]
MPDSAGLWRYIETTLLMLAMIVWCHIRRRAGATPRPAPSGNALPFYSKYYESCIILF